MYPRACWGVVEFIYAFTHPVTLLSTVTTTVTGKLAELPITSMPIVVFFLITVKLVVLNIPVKLSLGWKTTITKLCPAVTLLIVYDKLPSISTVSINSELR